MHPPRSRPITEHRLARFAVWLVALLAWLALGLTSSRHHRRYGAIGIGTLRRGVRNLVLIRAAGLHRPRLVRKAHRAAPAGFRLRRKRMRPRAIGGVWLRRRLIARGGFIAQVKHLLAAMRDWRALSEALAYRRRRGLTRIISITPLCPPAARVPIFAAPAPSCADTS